MLWHPFAPALANSFVRQGADDFERLVPALRTKLVFHALLTEASDAGNASDMLEALADLGESRSEWPDGLLGLSHRRLQAAAGRIVISHRAALRSGITRGPVVIFDDRHVIAGNQAPEVYGAMLEITGTR